MAKFTKKKDGDLPAVSTASLPDIVFMLLFFFMTVTTMKDSSLMVENTLPNATEIKKLEKKDRVIYVFVGKPTQEYQKVFGTEPKIQLNDKFANVDEVGTFIL
ncbi:MAG: biopolymer transporter ExbD, partial [Bacteroidota bacterium]|nr:biopolymer transporter ExbD [Bacteroidota bacterium]